jgi:hypothetical protein
MARSRKTSVKPALGKQPKVDRRPEQPPLSAGRKRPIEQAILVA